MWNMWSWDDTYNPSFEKTDNTSNVLLQLKDDISFFLWEIDNSENHLELKKWILWKASRLSSQELKKLRNYVGNLMKKSEWDNKSQLIELWSWLQNININQKSIEWLPESINITIWKWELYYNWRMQKDYRKILKKPHKFSNNLKNWLQQWEIWEMTLHFFRGRMKKIKIKYDAETWSILFEYNWKTIRKILTKRPMMIRFWRNVPKNERWNKAWKFLEFQIRLNWFQPNQWFNLNH